MRVEGNKWGESLFALHPSKKLKGCPEPDPVEWSLTGLAVLRKSWWVDVPCGRVPVKVKPSWHPALIHFDVVNGISRTYSLSLPKGIVVVGVAHPG